MEGQDLLFLLMRFLFRCMHSNLFKTKSEDDHHCHRLLLWVFCQCGVRTLFFFNNTSKLILRLTEQNY